MPRLEADRLEPGAETTIDVTVRDADGAPVAGAEFAVVVVDEAILALTGYQLIDPVSVFYSERRSRRWRSPQSCRCAACESHCRCKGVTPAPTGTPPPQQLQSASTSRQAKASGWTLLSLTASAPAAMAEMAMDEEMAEEARYGW